MQPLWIIVWIFLKKLKIDLPYDPAIPRQNYNLKKCSTLLIIREMQIKIRMKYYLTPVRMAIIKSLQIINAGEGVEKGVRSCTVGGNVN